MKSRLGQSDEPEDGGEGATPFSNVILINIRENKTKCSNFVFSIIMKLIRYHNYYP